MRIKSTLKYKVNTLFDLSKKYFSLGDVLEGLLNE
jgi:hypothetical protein